MPDKKEYPIADYALIGNCETAALINPDGGIDWLCLPAFDAPSFFGAMIDREKGGSFSLQPVGAQATERRYLDDTAILETRYFHDGATLKVTDFFVTARRANARFYDFTSLHPTRKLVRLLEVEGGGSVRVQAELRARPDYARSQPAWGKANGGFACAEASLFSNRSLEEIAGDLGGTFTVSREHPAFFVLDYAEDTNSPDLGEIRRWLAITRSFWREWNYFNYYRGPHEAAVRRSAITLKLLTYAPTGAIVAAPTTSLPEKPGDENNWDYRFTWTRDTALVISALFRLGYSGEAKAYFRFLSDAYQGRAEKEEHDLPVLLPIREGTPVKEETLDHLSGYFESRPVRRGNRVENQFQFDNQGHFLQALYYWKHCGGKIDKEMRDIATHAIDFLRHRWAEPDNGTWEPLERHNHTYSKIAAWSGLERGSELGLISRVEAEKLCAQIREQVLERGVRTAPDGSKYLAIHYDTADADAATLLAISSGFPDPELARGTRREVERQLGDGPWIYRTKYYREFGEGAFLLCSFWKIGHLINEGELDQAEALLEKHLAAASPLGLLSEEIDPASGRLLGNFPQGFSHLGLISAILDLQLARENPDAAALPAHRKFTRSVGRTIGARAVIEGFIRVPRTLRLLVSSRSKWKRGAATGRG